MRRKPNYQYYVEGEDEKKLLNTLKTDLRCIVPGKAYPQLFQKRF